MLWFILWRENLIPDSWMPYMFATGIVLIGLLCLLSCHG